MYRAYQWHSIKKTHGGIGFPFKTSPFVFSILYASLLEVCAHVALGDDPSPLTGCLSSLCFGGLMMKLHV